MKNELENDCDIILKFCLGLKHGIAFRYREAEESKLLPQTRLYVAIKELKQEKYFLPRNSDEHLDLTIEGRKFAESGGYAGKRQREEEAKIKHEIAENERIAKEQKQELLIDKQIQDLENRLSVFESESKESAEFQRITKREAIKQNRINMTIAAMTLIALLNSFGVFHYLIEVASKAFQFFVSFL